MDVNTPVIVDFQRSVNFKSAYKIVFIQNVFASCVKYLKYPCQVLVFQAQLDTDTFSEQSLVVDLAAFVSDSQAFIRPML